MKFSCEKALLQSAIAVTARAVSPKSSIPALEGILLEAGTDLRLTGYHLETGIRTVVPAHIDQEGSLVLSARLFGEIIRKLPDDIVSFQADGYMVNITCGMSQFNILATDPEDFPELPTVEDKNGFTIPRGKLGSMIRQTIFAVSDNESRPIHTGSLFEIDDTGLTVVSVDGYRLALRHEPITERDGALSFSFVVPGSALSEVEKICGDGEEEATVTQGERHVMFRVGDTMLVSRRLEGEFLAYRQAIPRNNGIKVRGTPGLCSPRLTVSPSSSAISSSPPSAVSLMTMCSRSPPRPGSGTPPTNVPSPAMEADWRSASITAI